MAFTVPEQKRERGAAASHQQRDDEAARKRKSRRDNPQQEHAARQKRREGKRFLLLLTSAMSRRMPCSMLDAALFLRCSCSRASRTRHGSSDGRKREAYQAARKCELAKPMQPARGVKVSVQ